MSTTIVVTNNTAAPVTLTELYSVVDASSTLTFTASVAQLDRMPALAGLVLAGTVSVSLTDSADNVDALSIPIQTKGRITGIDVTAIAKVATVVTFAKPFATSVVPWIVFGVVQNTSTAFKAKPYAYNITNTGFTAALDVTTADTSTTHSAEAVTWSPLPNGTLLGPFTGTLAHVPLSANALTIHWTESTVAKSA